MNQSDKDLHCLLRNFYPNILGFNGIPVNDIVPINSPVFLCGYKIMANSDSVFLQFKGALRGIFRKVEVCFEIRKFFLKAHLTVYIDLVDTVSVCCKRCKFSAVARVSEYIMRS